MNVRILAKSPACLFLIALIVLTAVPALAQGPGATVPNIVGLSVPEAAAVLNRAGIALGPETSVAWEESLGVEQNTIAAQDTPAGTVVAEGTAIAVTVARADNALLLYDDNDLTLINQTGAPINLVTLTFNALDGTSPASFAASRWAAELRPDQCAQLWSESRNGPKGLDECGYIQNWLSTNRTDEHFWTGSNGATQFNVVLDGIERAVCTIAAGRCAFYLPAPAADETVDFVYMRYTPDRFILKNASTDQWLPLGSLTIQNYYVPGGPYGVSLADRGLYSFVSAAASLDRLAPGQCILFTNSDPAITVPPEPCDVVARLDISPDLIFWAADFGLTGTADGQENQCPAARDDGRTLCVLPR